MNKFIAVAILAFAGPMVSAGYIGHHEEESHGHGKKKDYNFDYTVHDPHTHEFKSSHQEVSKDGVVKGYYSVKEADGSLREVHYTADKKNGFKAIVTKDGVQVHPHTDGSSHQQAEHHQEVEHHQELSSYDHQEHGFEHHPEISSHGFEQHSEILHDFGHHSDELSQGLGHHDAFSSHLFTPQDIHYPSQHGFEHQSDHSDFSEYFH